ncbi:hypothetical protein ANN_12862 [Periplaneta americana]|uniref:DUF4817 domain-containing protein n=1 Tax=Periplaneta americana TaxID=6978 RepID=A0ABQ8THR7_PERAM|nr:hypothetical protein ANN_12862 [Periplaneta americana]
MGRMQAVQEMMLRRAEGIERQHIRQQPRLHAGAVRDLRVVVITEDIQNVHLLLEYRPHIDVSLTCQHDPKLQEYCAYYENNDSFIAAQRLFRRHYNIHRDDPIPSAHAIKIWIHNFEVTGSALKKSSPGTPENINAIRVSMIRSPTRSARRHAISLGLSNTSIRRILHKNLHVHPYKIQVVQTLKDADKVNRMIFCQKCLDINVNLLFCKIHKIHNMLMSDEAHFHIYGYVNQLNFR